LPEISGVDISCDVVELNGALSNPLVMDEGRICRANALYHKILARKGSRPNAPAVIKPKAGAVFDTVHLVLSSHDRSMRVKEIKLACEAHLGYEVGWSAVKQCMSKNSMGKDSKYLRVGHGRYMVRPSSKFAKGQ